MNKSDKITLELAEKICKRKFEQTFGELDDKFYLDENNMEEFLKKQIQLWKEVGATHLSEHSLVILPPIKLALYHLCKDKIKLCMSKLLMLE
jgi:hypothetical protein